MNQWRIGRRVRQSTSRSVIFLIQHPRGNVLYDGGNALEVAGDRDPYEYRGAVTDAYLLVMDDEDFVVNQLERLDVDPASVRYVVQSHLHLDHSGAIGHFPNTEYVVQRRELELLVELNRRGSQLHDVYRVSIPSPVSVLFPPSIALFVPLSHLPQQLKCSF